MTDITVHTTSLLTEDLSWDLSPDMDAVYVEGGTLGVGAFTQAQHFPNGYIPSGTVVALATGGTYSGLYVPYLDAGTNGASTAAGILRASIKVVRNVDGSIIATVGCPVMKAWGVVSASKLPFTSTNAANGGYLDANGKADLPHIHFAA